MKNYQSREINSNPFEIEEDTMLKNIDRDIVTYYANRLLTKRKDSPDGEIISIITDFRKTITNHPFVEGDLKTETRVVNGKKVHEIIYNEVSDKNIAIPNFDDCLVYLFDEAMIISEESERAERERRLTLSQQVTKIKNKLAPKINFKKKFDKLKKI